MRKFDIESPDCDKENIAAPNLESTQYDIDCQSKTNRKKPMSTTVKKVKKPRGFDDFCHQPNLSKNSLLIASNMGDAFERLTSKTKSIKKNVRKPQAEDPSFKPKINSKSMLMTRDRQKRGCNRFLELHDQVD